MAAGIAVSAALSDSVPPHLEVLGAGSGLPQLPKFMINMHLPQTSSRQACARWPIMCARNQAAVRKKRRDALRAGGGPPSEQASHAALSKPSGAPRAETWPAHSFMQAAF